MVKSTVESFDDVEFIHGTAAERTVYKPGMVEAFTYDPEEWQLDVKLTRKVKPLVPGLYVKSYNGKISKTFGTYELYTLEVGETLPTLVSPGWEWCRVTMEEATE